MKMNRRILAGILVLMAVLLIASAPAFAAKVTGIKVTVNGKQVAFPDQQPYLDTDLGRTFIPVRFVSEALGAKVDWNQAKQTVTITTNTAIINMKIGSTQAEVTGVIKNLDAPARLENGRTMVPLRFVSEALDKEVIWHQDTMTVEIKDIDITGGYWVPEDLHGVGVYSPKAVEGGDRPVFEIGINTLKSLPEQYTVLHDILVKNGFADEQTAQKILDVVKTKTGFTPALDAEFKCNGYVIDVGSGGYSNLIAIYIWDHDWRK
ncbi:MAG: copper amine oxidase N-terminal domain-containing protein [Thermacetogeniaceae bacterium]